MEPVVAILPDQVIDQIAAGEVVERPASVVKELVENAVDAGARAITVEVEGGGRRLIRVVDDGVGMTAADARLALARHATSKLRSLDDLTRMVTMGFRGEALPSIASVSRLTLTTRTRDAEAGVRLRVEGGQLVGEDPVGAPVGTAVEVVELLHNVPARLKFLRGEATEASHVTETVVRLALAHPEVGFRLRHNGRTAVEVGPGAATARVRTLLGARLADRLHEVLHDEGGVRVRAWLAAPDLAQTTSRGLHLFAGRRWVRDRSLLQAVTMGYGELVPRGRYPVAVVMVDVPGADIDVNVHPQKLEVRFSDPQTVTGAVRHAVRKGVAAAPWLTEAAPAAPVQMHAVASVGPPRRADDLAARYADDTLRALFPLGGLGRAPTGQATLDLGGAARPAAAGSSPAREPGRDHDPWERVRSRVRSKSTSAPRQLRDVDREADIEAGDRARGEHAAAVADAPPAGAPAAPAADGRPGFFASLRYLGQLDRTYLVCEADGELVLIDQHAAHERVEFQRLRERSEADSVATQRLLFPQVVEVPPGEAAQAVDGAPLLAAVGFDVEPFGGGSLAVKAVPAGLRHDPATVLRELLGDLVDRGGSRALEERLDQVLATIACHSVVRAGDTLAAAEVTSLLGQMDGVDFRAHCPHGRPVLLRVSVAEIARRFGRT